MKNAYSPEYDEDDTQDETLTSVPAQPAANYPQPPSPLANPVLRNFDTPGQVSTNTVPAQEPAAQPQPAPPAPAPVNPFPLPPTPYAAPAPVHSVYRPSAAPQIPQPSAEDIEQAQEEQRQQYARDQAANLRYHKAQGGQSEVLPTGREVIKTDADGNALYHPQVLQPFYRSPEDGKGYRVSRDEYNNQHHFDLSQGAGGQDYHVDAQSGAMYVQTSGADGSSRREVIGQIRLHIALCAFQGLRPAEAQRLAWSAISPPHLYVSAVIAKTRKIAWFPSRKTSCHGSRRHAPGVAIFLQPPAFPRGR